jgi:hypothetical protein
MVQFMYDFAFGFYKKPGKIGAKTGQTLTSGSNRNIKHGRITGLKADFVSKM